MPDVREFVVAAMDWRDECLHKRTLYIEVIDRVPVDMLITLIDHAFAPATSGFCMRADEQLPREARLHRNPAEREWADVWKRHDRIERTTRAAP